MLLSRLGAFERGYSRRPGFAEDAGLRHFPCGPTKFNAATVPPTWSSLMTWKTPKIVEVPFGMEINMYACATRK
jgi:coenzyme PQQ precursor peptide PqqA